MRELALNVMDVAQNSISAKADLIRLTVEEDTAADRLTIRLEDNGCGMTPEQVKALSIRFTPRGPRERSAWASRSSRWRRR